MYRFKTDTPSEAPPQPAIYCRHLVIQPCQQFSQPTSFNSKLHIDLTDVYEGKEKMEDFLLNEDFSKVLA